MAAKEGVSEANKPDSSLSTEDLVRRVLDGETELFYELVKPYEQRLYVVANLVLRNEGDAEEVAQEALLKALKHLPQFRGESGFGSWLIQIGMNEARMRLKKRHTEIMRPIEEQENEDGDCVPQDFSDWREIPSEVLEWKEVREALRNAVAALDLKYRTVLVLRNVQQMSIQETAEVLSISQQTVKSRLLRARLMLRDMLAPGLSGQWFSSFVHGKGAKPWS